MEFFYRGCKRMPAEVGTVLVPDAALLDAQAISEGINCIAAIVVGLRADASASKDPDPAWVTVLHEMERAFEGIMANEVWTSMIVSEEDADRIRRVRALVSDWTTTRHPPPELRAEAESVLRFFQIPI